MAHSLGKRVDVVDGGVVDAVEFADELADGRAVEVRLLVGRLEPAVVLGSLSNAPLA